MIGSSDSEAGREEPVTVEQLRAQRHSCQAIGRVLGVGAASVRRALVP